MKILESLKLFGPNRRSEQTVFEVWLALTDDESREFDSASAEVNRRVLSELERLGADETASQAVAALLTGSPAQRYAALVGRIALALQRLAGHGVAFQATYPASDSNVACFAVEYEHGDDGLEAINLAIRLLEELFPKIVLGTTENARPFSEGLESYLSDAPAHLLPRDTQDIIAAAAAWDIPCVKLDRDPYEGVSGEFRIRPNGLLKLGHGCFQKVLDGTFPVLSGDDLAALAHDRARVRQVLQAHGAPLPDGQVCMTSRQAQRAGSDIGYPAVVKPLRFNRARHYGRVSATVHDATALQQAARACLQHSPGLLVEAFVPGRSWCALMADGKLVALLALEDSVAVADSGQELHVETRQWLEALAGHVGTPLLSVTLISDDATAPLGQSGKVVNLNVAPELDGLLDGSAFDSRRIRRAAVKGLIRSLFPEGSRARIPIVAVTGTNGKSTVCAMAARIMQQAGLRVGRAGTTGLYLDDEMLSYGDFSGGKGHHRILESSEVELAVLEAARGAASGFGLMFDACNVSVCTNVSNDHLGERGIETVDEMAELKRFIVQRARDAVVLNADNVYSAGMLPHLKGRSAWLVSECRRLDDMKAEFGNSVGFCLAESRDDSEWVVLHHGGRSEPVIRVGDIPATLDGLARFNVSNALQAIAAGFAMGATVQQIRAAMSGFANDFRTNPGRLNFYERHPFRVLFDYAHNDDSFRALRSVVDAMEVAGRKILVFARRGSVTDEELIGLGEILADGFDIFIAYDHRKRGGRQPGETSALLKRGLVLQGAPEDNVIESSMEQAVQEALNLARPGDLLVVATTTEGLMREWELITQFRPQ